jgi:predicted ArsR family transcriptional regulator
VKNAGATEARAAPLDEGASVPSSQPGPTRERVAQCILQQGPSTAGDLAARLNLTPAAVRRHLDHLLEEGLLEAREQRVYGHRGRGRPAKVFALTDAGRDAFYQAYDDLAVTALRFLAEQGGDEAVAAFARRRVADLEVRYATIVERAVRERGPGAASEALAEALTGDGYAASVRDGITGEQLCQHHCPVAHVAAEFPQLCEAETEVFARLLGRHVQRLATIAHGDGVCTTHVPDPDAVKALSHDGAAHDPATHDPATERTRPS